MPYLPDPVSSTFAGMEDVRPLIEESAVRKADRKTDMARFLYLMAMSRENPREIRKAELRLHKAAAESARHRGGKNEDILVLQQKIYMGLGEENRRKLVSWTGLAFLAYLLTRWCV